MGQELTLPANFKGPAKAFAAAGLNAIDDNLASGIGQSYAVINYKGKIWSLRYRGERKTFIRADDGTPANYLDVIILGQAKDKSKSFFAKYDPNAGDGGDRPLCASLDGLLPDDDVTDKQSDTCALCVRNVWKTDPNTGRRGRECQDYKRLAVLILPTQTKLILGSPLMEPAFLRVPAASLNSLAIMGETMSKQGYHYSSYITRITFDPQKSWPEMMFKPVQELTNAEAPVIIDLIRNPLVERITIGDTSKRDPNGLQVVNPRPLPPAPSATPAPPPTITVAAPSSVPMPTPAPLPAAPSAPLAIDSGLSTTASAFTGLAPDGLTPDPTPTAPLSSAGSGILSGGANGVIPAPPAPDQSSGVLTVDLGQQNGTTTAAIAAPPDAGVAEESDTDLDARIAGILANKA